MGSLFIGSLVDTAEVIPEVWVSISSKQDLHHTLIVADGCHHQCCLAKFVPCIDICTF